MDRSLSSYIDNNLIREHAQKTKDGYSLHIVDLNNHEQENLLSWLFNHDYHVKELILDRAQELINERIPFVESKDNYANGLYPTHDKQTGEVNWSKVGGF
jgi:hypothetical protein